MDNRIMSKYNIEDIYNAMAYTETGGYEDPWIRTTIKGSGSNAYGPVQLLSSTLSGATKQTYADSGKPMIEFTKDELSFIDRFREQGEKFYTYGGEDMVPGMESYGYGGSGDMSKEDRKLYKSSAKKVIAYELKRAGDDLDKFQEEWRGPTGRFEGGKDVRHNITFKERLKKLAGIRELMPDETVMGEIIKENAR